VIISGGTGTKTVNTTALEYETYMAPLTITTERERNVKQTFAVEASSVRINTTYSRRAQKNDLGADVRIRITDLRTSECSQNYWHDKAL
jgi:hypothetical protein